MHSFSIVQTGLVSGNYDSAGGIRDPNPLNTEINVHDIQFVPRRELHVLRPIKTSRRWQCRQMAVCCKILWEKGCVFGVKPGGTYRNHIPEEGSIRISTESFVG